MTGVVIVALMALLVRAAGLGVRDQRVARTRKAQLAEAAEH
ncbi:hypothetical protein [Paenibacillus puerhi]|nr:hypothetical protein [Paenibacillus puerhi]